MNWRAGAAWVATAVLAAGCSGGRSAPIKDSPASVQEASPYAAEIQSGVQLQGTVYVLGGEQLSSLKLYRWAPPYESLEEMAGGAAISAVTACAKFVAVAAPQPFADRIALADDDGLVDLPGAGRPRGSAPAFSPGCKLAFIRPAGERTDGFTIKTWTEGDRVRSVLSKKKLGTLLAWVDDQVLAFAEQMFPPFTIGFSSERYSRVKLGSRITQLNGLLGLPGRLVATQTSPGRVVRANQSPTVVLRDWEALAWSPDGTRLLLARNGVELGIWRLGRKSVRPVLDSPIGPIYDGAWTP
jgi:hypothetical protein